MKPNHSIRPTATAKLASAAHVKRSRQRHPYSHEFSVLPGLGSHSGLERDRRHPRLLPAHAFFLLIRVTTTRTSTSFSPARLSAMSSVIATSALSAMRFVPSLR